MRIYRIGRCTAYEQARRYLDDGSGHGIPCIRLGHSIRFPIAWIEAHIGSTQRAAVGPAGVTGCPVDAP